MITELMARAGKAVLGDTPPAGRAYWAARFWDRDSAERHPVLAGEVLRQKATVSVLLRQYGGQVETVLEFACGTGEFTRLAAELTPAREITAVDISDQALALAGRRVQHPGLRLRQGDFWQDNGLDRADLVMCIDAIHHLGDVAQVLRRLRTFVAPDGLLIGNLWVDDHFHEFQRSRYGSVRHLVRTLGFLTTALLIRASGGRLKTGSYRTQLLHSNRLRAILEENFGEVLDVSVERYFVAFACKP